MNMVFYSLSSSPGRSFRSAQKTRAPSAPTTKPSGPVIRMPSSGPRLACGQMISGPTKPKARPIPPTRRPALQLFQMRARLSRWWARRANHQHNALMVQRRRVIGTQKNQPSQGLACLRFCRQTHTAKQAMAEPATAAASRRAPMGAKAGVSGIGLPPLLCRLSSS